MKKTTLYLLKIYKKILSPILVVLTGSGCRFNPTCSEYAMEAIDKHGLVKGTKLSVLRLARCHPFNKSSNFDPVPEI